MTERLRSLSQVSESVVEMPRTLSSSTLWRNHAVMMKILSQVDSGTVKRVTAIRIPLSCYLLRLLHEPL